MTNIFLEVNKDLFKLGLNPAEILLLAQVMEYERNTGDFFMSDETLARQIGVSSRTISRTFESLEGKNFLTRQTTNIKGGRTRHVQVNIGAIELALK